MFLPQVSYDATNFHKMAKTGLPKDCKRVMNSSKLALLQRMFPDGAQSEWMKGGFSVTMLKTLLFALCYSVTAEKWYNLPKILVKL